MKKRNIFFFLLIISFGLSAVNNTATKTITQGLAVNNGLSSTSIRLDQLDVINTGTVGWGTMKKNLSIDGNPLTLKGVVYAYGIGTHSPGRIDIKLNKNATKFSCVVGIDDEVSMYKPDEAIAEYSIINNTGGTETVVQSGVIKRTDTEAVEVELDITGWEYLSLVCSNSNGQNWSDHVDWCDATITYDDSANPPVSITYEDMVAESKMYFDCVLKHYSLPNVRMMHRFRTNNENDVISVSNLPAGLEYNAERKLVEGKIATEGTYKYNVTLTRESGFLTKEVTVNVSSDLVSPTPLMGWMSWNIFQDKINETNIKQVADLLVSTGLSDAGFNYVLIDDHWHGKERDKNGKIDCNYTKFPLGLNYLTDYIHEKGLKAGIYSDAAEKTCGGELGSLNYEILDAQQYADWGFDFLKYDYCGAPNDVEVAKKRYKTMSDALKGTGKSFYFNICEWGQRKPWLWAAEAGGHSWRVSFDSRDIWDHGTHDGDHCGVVQAIDILKDISLYAGPNQFNDADMMCVGLYGTGKPSSMNGATGMNDTEYQSQFSMWSILSSPLLISFDLSKMNKETLRILTNKEVIAINQDPMGQQAVCVYSQNGREVFMKDLENGDVAVALLNRGNSETKISIELEKLFLKEKKYIVRDLWLHKDIETVTDKVSATVKSHETKLFRIKLDDGSGINENKINGSQVIYSQNKNHLNLELNGFKKSKVDVKIISMSGSILSQKTAHNSKLSLDVANIPSGLYVLNVSDGKISNNAKISIN